MTTFSSRAAGALVALSLVAAALVAGTAGAASAQSTTTFQVTITNQANPESIISPGAYLVHAEAGALWISGQQASLAIERIAEVGDPTEALKIAGSGMIDAAPASGDSVTFQVSATPGMMLSLAQMLVASNDGFVGVDSLALFNGTTPRTVAIDLTAWDAGTEANSAPGSGFAGGQPDPSQGAANVDNGTATSEAISAHTQYAGTQATLTVTPLLTPASTGSAGLNGEPGTPWALVAGLMLVAVALTAGARTVARNR